MKVSAMPSNGIPVVDTQGVTAPQSHPMHSIKMITNANPSQENHPIPPTNEAQVKEPSAVTQPLDPKLVRIARERRALQLKEKMLAEREKALLERPSSEGFIDSKRLKSDPLNVLLENGVTYEQLAQAVMSNQSNSEVLALKQEIESLRKGVDEKFNEKDALAEQQILAEMRREAHSLSRSDEFELVRETRSVPLVMKLITRTWRERKEVLDVPIALRLVEAELLKDQQRLIKAKKMQSLYQPTLQTQQRQPQGMRTLTNRDTASVPMSRKARALGAFYGTYKG